MTEKSNKPKKEKISEQKDEKQQETKLETEANQQKTKPDFHPVFTYVPIPEQIKKKINGKSYPEDCPISYDELRYLQVSYIDFDGNPQTGELICNKTIAEDLTDIFQKLYEAKYPIEKISLIDDYNADDEASMSANNSSCFCYRTISGSNKISKHGYGLAVDINPKYNPYVTSAGVTPANGAPYASREKDFKAKITTDDLCYQLFTEHGFTWGGSWSSRKDYQHFEK